MFHAIARTAGAAGLVALATMAIFFMLNHASLGRGGETRIGAALASGALPSTDRLRGDPVRGDHQFNDCLILGLATDQRYSAVQLTVSPSLRSAPPDVCRKLRMPPDTDRQFYHNYIHGHTMLARYLLPVMSVELMRELYRGLTILALMSGLAMCVLQLAKGRRESAVFGLVIFVLARTFGLEIFGQSLSHGPSDLILALYLAFLSVAVLSRGGAIIASALFGALTMIFEFLTGGIPLGLAAVIGLTWFALKERNYHTVALSALAFAIAAITCFAIKIVSVAVVFGHGAVAGMFGQLGTRVAGEPEFANPGVLIGLIDSADSLMPGLGPMALLLVLLSMGAGGWAVMKDKRPEVRLLGVSTAVVFGWFMIFNQHSGVHAWFMVRLMAWVIAAGFAAFLLAVYNRAEKRTSLIKPTV